VLGASAWDQRLDVFGSLVVLISLAGAMRVGPALQNADHFATSGVAGIILWAGGSLFWTSLQDVMDRQAEAEMLETVRRLAMSVAGVRGVEELRIRKAGLEYVVDIHLEVEPDISVRNGHEIGHAVKDRLLAEFVGIKDILAHIEPSSLPAFTS
jgi:cation diffusion facilitator family transporter